MPMQLKYVQGNITVLPFTASRKGILPTFISKAWIDHTPNLERTKCYHGVNKLSCVQWLGLRITNVLDLQ